MNKPHIGRRPKWLATQIGAPPNWRCLTEKLAAPRCWRLVSRLRARYPLLAFKPGGGEQPNRASYCGKLISGGREKKAAVNQAAAPLSLRTKMLMSAYLPECRADGMADVRDLKSRGDFPRVGSTPTPGTTSLKEKRRWQKANAADLIAFCGSIRRGQIRLRTQHPASHENYSA
jgi:hypothetical protein